MAEPPDDATRQLLRHTVATLAYRAGKVLRDAPAEFAAFWLTPASRSAVVGRDQAPPGREFDGDASRPAQ